MPEEYSKHKEREPEETVFEIQRILNGAGLFTVTEWTSGGVDGAFSNRVYLYPLKSLGQNGKGTDRRYAAASGYAELMERMQNSWLGQRLHDPELCGRGGFFEFPDEKLIPPEELISQGDPFLRDVFARMGCITRESRISLLQFFAKEYYGREDGKIPAVPYVDLFEDRIVFLPFALITLFCLSNGMTAGNTPEEAMVQGFSEILERYVHRKILEGEQTPPEIPREELKKYGFYPIIESIEHGGQYSVSVRDCSLGEGYPVSCVIVTDRQSGTFGMKPGCHPSFAVATERALTEAFQGKRLDALVQSNTVGSPESVRAFHNTLNVLKTGFGTYPSSLLTGAESWSFRPWTQWEGLTNREYLEKLIAFARLRGFRPMIRDSSHMGFPCYHIVIPGISNVLPVSPLRLRDFRSQLRAARSLQHFPFLSDEEKDHLLTFCQFKDTSVEFAMGIPFMNYIIGKEQSPERIEAFLALDRGKYALAGNLLGRLAGQEPPESEEGSFLRAAMAYASCRKNGMSPEEAKQLIRVLFRESTARKVCEIMSSEDGILERTFPGARKCFDCASCVLAGKGCEYAEGRKVYEKIKDAMSHSRVNIEALREKLRLLSQSAGR